MPYRTCQHCGEDEMDMVMPAGERLCLLRQGHGGKHTMAMSATPWEPGQCTETKRTPKEEILQCQTCDQPICSICAVMLEDGPHCPKCAVCEEMFRCSGLEDRERCDQPATHCNEDGELRCVAHDGGTRWSAEGPGEGDAVARNGAPADNGIVTQHPHTSDAEADHIDRFYGQMSDAPQFMES